MLVLDGGFGEGGGQILRTALSLSLATGTPFRLVNIRAGRPRPGLGLQHLTAVQAAAQVGDAQVEGAELGSRELTFVPGRPRPGHYAFATGSAGSVTLVLQTVLPPLLTAPAPTSLLLEGGTHNPFAPPFEFLARAFAPLVERMGPQLRLELDRPGFYPAGGGRLRARIEPAQTLARIHLLERGAVRRVSVRALVSALPRAIGERELATAQRILGLAPSALHLQEISDPAGPGNAVLVEVEGERVTEVFAAFGQRGVRAEVVAERAAREALRYIEAGVPVGTHLADQLLLPMALASGGSFRTLPPSTHTTTNIEVIRRFLGVRITAKPEDSEVWRIEVGPP